MADAAAHTGRRSPHSAWTLAVLALVGLALFAGFIALGMWQVQRRAWKLDLIERTTERIHAAPGTPPSVAQWPEVVQCATITGREDYVLRIITSDMHAFDQFLRHKLLSLGIVSDCESHIVTRGVKNVTALPLGIVTPHVS